MRHCETKCSFPRLHAAVEVWTSVCPKKRTPLLPHVQMQVPLLAIIEYRVHTFEVGDSPINGAPALQGLEPAGH